MGGLSDFEEKMGDGTYSGFRWPLQRGLYVVYVSHGQTLHRLSKEQEKHRGKDYGKRVDFCPLPRVGAPTWILSLLR